jgi:hypothetical protein
MQEVELALTALSDDALGPTDEARVAASVPVVGEPRVECEVATTAPVVVRAVRASKPRTTRGTSSPELEVETAAADRS